MTPGDARATERTPGVDASAPARNQEPRTGSVTFTTVVWCAVTGLVVFSILGLVLAMCGWFRPLPVIGGTAALTVVLLRWLLPAVADHPEPVRPHWALTAGVLVVAVVAGVWNGLHHGEHLIAERDPGVYVATGLWLGDHGSLRVAPPEGPFEMAPGVRQAGIGFSANDHDSLDPQFAHLNAVFLAAASWFGNVRMLLVPPLLMSGALVMLYALGVRLGRPVAGAAATVAFAVSYPFVFVARDTYSEPVALLALLCGLWALTFVRRGGLRFGLLAGALLGATCLARIDGFVPLIPIAGVVALEWQLARRRGDDDAASGYRTVGLAACAVAALGAYDVWAFSRSYFNSNLGPRLFAMTVGILGAAVAGAVAGRYLFRSGEHGEAPRGFVRWLVGAAAVVVVAYLGWARFVRPDVAELERRFDSLDPGAHERVVDLLPLAESLSYLWLEWYLGPLLVALGFAGLFWMTGRALFGGDRAWLPVAGVGFATTLLYIHAPSITPDHPWAIRRFVAVSIPLLLLAAAMALETLGRRRPPWSAVGAAVVGVVLLVVPVQVTARLADTAPGDSLATRYDQICAFAHDEPSAILVTPGQALGYTMPIALRSWCDVPVAGAIGSVTPGEIRALSLRWRAEGRRLLILSTSPEGLVGVGGANVMPVPGPVLTGPEGSVTHVPRRIVPDRRLAQSADGVIPIFLIEVA